MQILQISSGKVIATKNKIRKLFKDLIYGEEN